jgi:hypothetical protein
MFTGMTLLSRVPTMADPSTPDPYRRVATYQFSPPALTVLTDMFSIQANDNHAGISRFAPIDRKQFLLCPIISIAHYKMVSFCLTTYLLGVSGRKRPAQVSPKPPFAINQTKSRDTADQSMQYVRPLHTLNRMPHPFIIISGIGWVMAKF